MTALFPSFIGAIKLNQAARILKHQCRELE
jgi:hypothetical protein